MARLNRSFVAGILQFWRASFCLWLYFASRLQTVSNISLRYMLQATRCMAFTHPSLRTGG